MDAVSVLSVSQPWLDLDMILATLLALVAELLCCCSARF